MNYEFFLLTMKKSIHLFIFALSGNHITIKLNLVYLHKKSGIENLT